MKFANLVLLATALTAAVPATAAVSSAVGRQLSIARNASGAAAITAINNARAAARTPEERTKVAQMAAYVYTKAGQYGRAAQELEGLGAPPAQLAGLYYNAGNLDKAVSYAKRAGGENMQILIAQAAVKRGRYGEAVTAYNNLIRTNGPKSIYLENLSGAQYKSGDKRGYLATTTRLIKQDPTPARWKALLTNLRQTPMTPDAKLALYRLMNQVGTLDRNEDFLEFAKLALVAGQAGTAKEILAKAGSAGTDAMSVRLAQAADQRAAQAAAQAPRLAASPATAYQAGNAYLGLNNFGAAAAAYDKAIATGGSDADPARLFKGIAQLRGGAIGASRTSFAQVPEASPLKDIAQMWGLYASTKG